MTPEEFTARYMPQFSEQQKAAVRETEGPVLLLAVPGSGKTTVLVTRLGYMALCRGIDPAHILAVTYTVAATRELRARFTARFPELAGQTPEFRTINGLSSKIIEACGRQRGPAFALQENAGELAALVGRIYQALNGDYPTDSTIREVRTAITYCKNMMLSADEIAAQDFGLPRFSELYTHYCAALREARQMDYDDQMAYALAILRKQPEILAEFQARYPYLCVDESQDTSRVQHAIIELLAKKTGNLFMVGDEDQSIYGFRAAYPEALLRFSSVWPGAKTLLLEDNYRSTPEILRLAGAFIEGNRDRYPKTIRATRAKGCRVRLAHAASRQAQYRYLLALAGERARRLPSCTETTTAPFRSSTRWSAPGFRTAAAALTTRSLPTASSATCRTSCASPQRRTTRSAFCASIINSALSFPRRRRRPPACRARARTRPFWTACLRRPGFRTRAANASGA